MPNCRPCYRNHAARAWRLAFLPLCLASPVLLPGCSVRDDVSFNPYAANDGDLTLLETADEIVESAEQAVRDLDLRLEHAVY